MTRLEFQTELFDFRDSGRVNANVVAEAERAVIGKNLDDGAVSVSERLGEFDVIGAFFEIGSKRDSRNSRSESGGLRNFEK